MLYLDYSRGPGLWEPNIYGGRENLEAVAFLRELNSTVYRNHPDVVVIAEESTAWPGVTHPAHLDGLGFGLKWNMGWMHDTLSYVREDSAYRQFRHHQMTFSLTYAWSENYVLPISHDEVVHGKGSLVSKMSGDPWQQRATVRALLACMWAHPGKQLLFMGCEFGQRSEWSQESGLDWDDTDRGIQTLVRDLNREYVSSPGLWSNDTLPGGFQWLEADDAVNNTLAWLRYGVDGSVLVFVANFGLTPRANYRIGLPRAGAWAEIINTDSAAYGGSNVGNLGVVQAVHEPLHDQPASAALRLPPLGTVWLRPVSERTAEVRRSSSD
jgi:1,4-alpha-glucan branching enzyme